MALRDDVWRVIAEEGVIGRRDHLPLRGCIDSLVKAGSLRAVLPGVYAETSTAEQFEIKVAALHRWCPDAVLTGSAAARVTFWPTLSVGDVAAAVPGRGRYAGFRLETRRIPADLVVDVRGLRATSPALTALDLCIDGTDALDEVLRTRSATLADLWEALELTPGRRGNRRRLRHLVDSRAEPWSAAERLCHRLLHEAGLEGWESNLPVRSGDRRYYLDVAFPEPGLAVEIDGRLHETDGDVFETDRWRQNDLVLDGWVVLRFTWTMLTEHPEVVVSTVKAALRVARDGRPTRYRHSIERVEERQA